MGTLIAFILIFLAFVTFFAALKMMRYSKTPGKFIPWVIIPIVVIILAILYLLFTDIVNQIFKEIVSNT
ncbi:MAG: hypothetical protein IJU93_03680 [Lachnospiraceae bacterium]|nr:hypothetical protein [Lachnospiraceae bacterium]